MGILHQNTHIEGKQKMLKALLKLELALIDLTNDMNNIKLGLLSLLQARVTPTIVPDKVFVEILQEATRRSPGLLFPAMPEYLVLYMDLTKVMARPVSQLGVTQFYFTIPLSKDRVDTFDVFRIDILRYMVPNNQYIFQH